MLTIGSRIKAIKILLVFIIFTSVRFVLHWPLPQQVNFFTVIPCCCVIRSNFNTQYMLLLSTTNAFLFASILLFVVLLNCAENSMCKSECSFASPLQWRHTHTHTLGWLAHRYRVSLLLPMSFIRKRLWISLWRNLRVHFQDDTPQLNKTQEYNGTNEGERENARAQERGTRGRGIELKHHVGKHEVFHNVLFRFFGTLPPFHAFLDFSSIVFYVISHEF